MFREKLTLMKMTSSKKNTQRINITAYRGYIS